MNDRTTSDYKEIPRRVLISDPSDITCSYSSTPGGTLYSTTPGGTRIVYERSFLLNMRNSPLSRTPPSWEIPDALQKRSPKNGIIAPPNDKKQKRNKPMAKRQTKPQVTKTTNSIEEIEQFPLEL